MERITQKELCAYCNKKDLSNLNEFNKNEHQKACQTKNPRLPTIVNFFKKQIGTTNLKSSNAQVDLCESTDSEIEDVTDTDEISNILDKALLKRNDKHKTKKGKQHDLTQNTIRSDSTIIQGNNTIIKCEGYVPKEHGDQIYTNFPWQQFQLKDLPFIFENGKFHCKACVNNNYVYLLNNESSNTNPGCINLQFDSYLKKYFERAEDLSLHANYEYLNWKQAVERLNYKSDKINQLKLDNLNKDHKIITYRNQLALYKKFKLLLANNDVERIRQLMEVCIKNNAGIKSIIEKFTMAANELYRPKGWNKNDIDLAKLVLRIGGPALLYSFNQQNKLPSASFIYKILKNETKIEFKYSLSVTDIIRRNIYNFFNKVNGFFSIKMDEIAIKPHCRYNNHTNEIVGFCWNHRDMVNSFHFDNHLTINQIKRKFTAKEIHLANDAICITIGEISNTNIVPKPVIVLPLCSHSLFEINDIIYAIKETFLDCNPIATLFNVATDGDHFRRKMFNSVREASTNTFFTRLRYFDSHLMFGTLGINFDIKHLIKRLRGIIISDKRSIRIAKRPLTKNHIAYCMPKLNHLLNPKDYQNVPFAVQLMHSLVLFNSKQVENNIEKDILNEIACLSEIVEPLLNIFINPEIDLFKQMIGLAYSSHLLLFVYRKWKGQFLTKQLYIDIQSTIQDAFIMVDLFHRKNPQAKVYLYQTGTDQVEELFGNVRTITHSKNCDFLELNERLQIANQINTVFQDHPEWRRSSRISTFTNDHSSINSWTGKLTTEDFTEETILNIWSEGKDSAIDFLKTYGYTDADFDIINTDVTMLNPFGNYNKDIITEGEMEDLVFETQVYNKDNNEIDQSLPEIISDQLESQTVFPKTIDIEGLIVYKSNAVSSMINCSSKLSSSRPNRVYGLSSDCFTAETEIHMLNDNEILVTDIMITLCYNQIYKNNELLFFTIDKIIYDNNTRVSINPDLVFDSKFSGIILNVTEYCSEHLVWNGEYLDKIDEIPGLLCSLIKCSSQITSQNEREIVKNEFPLSEIQLIKEYLQRTMNTKPEIKIPTIKLKTSSETKIRSILQLNSDSNSANNDKIKCKICDKILSKINMRQHVGKHIVNKEASGVWKDNLHRCGFCGIDCQNQVEIVYKGSVLNGTPQVKSKCNYFVKFSMAPAAKSTQRSPCTNRPVQCQICQLVYWSYNMAIHYKTDHQHTLCQELCIPDKTEIEKLMRLVK